MLATNVGICWAVQRVLTNCTLILPAELAVHVVLDPQHPAAVLRGRLGGSVRCAGDAVHLLDGNLDGAVDLRDGLFLVELQLDAGKPNVVVLCWMLVQRN